MYRQSEKRAKQQYILHMVSQYGELRPINGCDRFTTTSVGFPSKFNGFRVLASILHRDVAQRRSTKLCKMFGLVHYIYIFGGSCPITKYYQAQYSLSLKVLRSLILAALLHSTRVVGVSQTFRRSAEGATYIRQGGHHVGHRPRV